MNKTLTRGVRIKFLFVWLPVLYAVIFSALAIYFFYLSISLEFWIGKPSSTSAIGYIFVIPKGLLFGVPMGLIIGFILGLFFYIKNKLGNKKTFTFKNQVIVMSVIFTVLFIYSTLYLLTNQNSYNEASATGIKYNPINILNREEVATSSIELIPGNKISDCEFKTDKDKREILVQSSAQKNVALISFQNNTDFNKLVTYSEVYNDYRPDETSLVYNGNYYLLTLVNNSKIFVFNIPNTGNNKIYCRGNSQAVNDLALKDTVKMEAKFMNEISSKQANQSQNDSSVYRTEQFIPALAFYDNNKLQEIGYASHSIDNPLVIVDQNGTVNVKKEITDFYGDSSTILDSGKKYLLTASNEHTISILDENQNIIISHKIDKKYNYIRSIKGVIVNNGKEKYFAILAKLRATSGTALLLLLKENGELAYEEMLADHEVAEDYQYINKVSENQFTISISDGGLKSYLYKFNK